ARSAPGSGRGLHELGSPFVGREQELAALKAALDDLSTGRGQIVAILGEAGIGKSRLVEESRRADREASSRTASPSRSSPVGLGSTPEGSPWERSRSAPGLRWLEGRALSYGETLSFWTITQLINQDLALSEGDPEAKIKVALRKRVHALFGGEAANLLPYLAHLMGVKLEDDSAQRVRQLDGETLKRQALWAIGEYFSAVAHEQPTVLVFEDLHWADPSTLEALQRLLPLTDRVPLLLLLLARVERDHGSWQVKLKAETDYAHRYTEIQVRPLSSADSIELVDRLLEVANLPERIRYLMLEHSEGNPFYLEEIIRSLIEQGVIVHEGSGWRATAEITDVEIPETLQGVLLARIDRLQEDVRRTLQLASVIGRSFLYRLLEAIAAAERQVDQHLSLLQRADLVREKTRRPELEYIFKHSLTQEAAYNSLLIERRKEFHRRVGEALEQLFAGREDEFYGLLAHHFDAAGEAAKATDYLIKAGDKARLEDAHEEAVRFYRRAIELLEQSGDVQRAVKTWLKLGLIHQMNFRFEEAHAANETAFALERQARPDRTRPQPDALAPGQPRTLRLCFPGRLITTADPRRLTFQPEAWLSSYLFAGLAEFDEETNLVPHAARSWEVLDGGRRYVFHLRDDIRWTDGTPLTARDFELTWRNFLAPDSGTPYPNLLDDVLGAREYREGRNADPESVGVRALDPFTLEVRLIAPVAYFIYRVAQPPTFALPLKSIQAHGSEWWKPGNIISSGAFRLVEWDAGYGRIVRNPDYFGEFPGNLEEFVWRQVGDQAMAVQAYLNGQADFVLALRAADIPPGVQADMHPERDMLQTGGLILNPLRPPLDDIRIRRAIAQGVDRKRLMESLWNMQAPSMPGGIVPPGMAGHSPELGLPFDLERARQYLAEAGYPGGAGLPILKFHYPESMTVPYQIEWKRRLSEGLGIQVETEPMSTDRPWWLYTDGHIQGGGWIADYPDPHNFLQESNFYRLLEAWEWRHPRLEQLLDEAAHTTDRARRLAMYREADRILVNDEVVVMPFLYGLGRAGSVVLLRPWVKGMKFNALGNFSLKDIVIAPH
ncbi:MAG TPA: ABC transporter substrate-binding protein, partial [Anaerolineales bacterium]